MLQNFYFAQYNDKFLERQVTYTNENEKKIMFNHDYFLKMANVI